MKRMSSALASMLAVLSIAATVPAMAEPATALPREQMQGTVAYVTGGIGLDESSAIIQAAPGFPLELEFVRNTMGRNEYLSDVTVTIKDHTGRTVLETVSGGPFLLARLPTGQFMVSAERSGEAKQHVVNIRPEGHERVMFEWQ